MRLIEIYFWNCAFWFLYLCISLALYVFAEQGTVLGTLIIGLAVSATLSIILSLMDGVLWTNRPRKISKTALMDRPEPAPKRGRRKNTKQKQEPHSVSKEKRMEVDSHDEEKSRFDGVEPEPKMRTDVDLDRLDADDDDSFS